MNLDKLRGAVTKNKVALGALGAVAVGAMAWRARSSTSSTSSSSDVAAPAGSSATPSYYTGGSYDSSSSDVYNALQPALEAVSGELEQIRDLYSTIPVPGAATTPAPAPVPTPAASFGDARRDSIAGFYSSILGRGAGLSEVNLWDASGQSIDQIRQSIVTSEEARTTAR